MAGRRALFHGTATALEVGEHVLPSSKTGNTVWGRGPSSYQDARKHAFATEDENTAWDFAKQAYRMQKSEHLYGYRDTAPDRARVYEVAPHPQMKPGNFHEESSEWIAPRFRTTKQHDIRPGKQGTFPQINWNQFKDVDAGAFDANHPDPEPDLPDYYPKNRREVPGQQTLF